MPTASAPALRREPQQVAVAAADLQQAEAGPRAADLVEQIVELPLDALFERPVAGQVLAVREVADPDRFGGVD